MMRSASASIAPPAAKRSEQSTRTSIAKAAWCAHCLLVRQLTGARRLKSDVSSLITGWVIDFIRVLSCDFVDSPGASKHPIHETTRGRTNKQFCKIDSEKLPSKASANERPLAPHLA